MVTESITPPHPCIHTQTLAPPPAVQVLQCNDMIMASVRAAAASVLPASVYILLSLAAAALPTTSADDEDANICVKMRTRVTSWL